MLKPARDYISWKENIPLDQPESDATEYWRLTRNPASQNLILYDSGGAAIFDAESGTGINFPQGITVGDGNNVLNEGDPINADTLGGNSPSSYLRADAASTLASGTTITVDGTVTAGSGAIDATTLDGSDAQGIRPSVADDGTQVLAGPTDINFAGNLDVTDDADGTLTVAVADPDSVNDTRVNVSDDGTQVVSYATDINFAGGLGVTDDADGSVTVDGSPTGVSDSGTSVVDPVSDINFASGVAVTDDGDGSVTIDASVADTHADVSANGSTVLSNVDDINFASNLSVADDGDGSVTVNANIDNADADTLDGLDATAFLRSDQAASTSYQLTVGGGLALSGSAITAADSLTFDGGTDNTATIDIPDASDGVVELVDQNNTDATVMRAPTGGPLTIEYDTALAQETRLGTGFGSNAEFYFSPYESGHQALTNGGNLAYDYNSMLAVDTSLVFKETDTDTVFGWVSSDDESLTLTGGLKLGTNTTPTETLDVEGTADISDATATGALTVNGTADVTGAATLSDTLTVTGATTHDGTTTFNAGVDFNGNEATALTLETRTSDPTSPATGRIWVRTDNP